MYRILLIIAAVVFCTPILLLHAASFMMSLRDRGMKVYASKVLTDSSGHILRFYELPQTNALWNIIFIHGTPGSAAVFTEQFRHPFPRANLLALDRPGFGASCPNRRRPSLDDQADAVGALLSSTPGIRNILVGHSYGGPVALQAALKFPDRVAGVLLIGGSVDPGQERIYTIQRVADWPLLSWLLPRPLRQCNRELLTLRGDLIRMQPQLTSLSVPVVMLHGDRDRQVPVANVAWLRGQLAADGKAGLFDALVFPEYNHFIPWEHPDAVEAALRKLTDRLDHPALNP
jgi:pimeloyl-ACP methyl ester carboxylesterase